MSHPFGDLLSQHLHRKHGLSQSKLAAGILQDPSIIGKMCKGQRLTGPRARERVLTIIGWLREQAVLETVGEANALLTAAGMSPLQETAQAEQTLLRQLRAQPRPDRAPVDAPTGGPIGVPAGLPSVTSARRTNLPAPLTSFVGCTHELAEVAQLCVTQRLVTLTGAGGVGKTRLATEVGIRLVQSSDVIVFAHGVWLVELAALTEPMLVAQAIARLFKLPEQPDSAALDLLQDYLADRHLLLILDNCEHLADTCAEIAQHLLQHCWQLHILATSREALRLPGEHLYRVQPLALPDVTERAAERMLACASAKLFMERMQLARPAFKVREEDAATVARICRQLDGIPLALELAAPLIRSMTLPEIAGQLRDEMAVLKSSFRAAIPRHQTMHSALLWSYRLLTPAEQQLLARVSVFAGGWTLAAAQAICAGEPVTDLCASHEQLVSKSFVLVEDRHGQQRYRLLEPVRQFAHDQLVTSGEEAQTRRAHAGYYLVLAEHLEQARDTVQEREWLERLEPERDNLRATNGWALEGREAEFALLFNGALFAFWIYRSNLVEARHWLEAALALQSAAATPAAATAEARALDVAGYLMVWHHPPTAQVYFERELDLYTEMGHQPRIAEALRGCGFAAMIRGDLAQAQEYTERGLALSQEATDRQGVAWSLFDLGYLAYVRGDLDRAAALLEEALPELQAEGMVYGACRALFALGHVMRGRAELERARAFYQEGLRIQQAMHYIEIIADGLEGLAVIATLNGHGVRAAGIFAAAHAHRETTGWHRYRHDEAGYERTLELARRRVDPEAWRAAWEAGCAMTLEQAVEYALGE